MEKRESASEDSRSFRDNLKAWSARGEKPVESKSKAEKKEALDKPKDDVVVSEVVEDMEQPKRRF